MANTSGASLSLHLYLAQNHHECEHSDGDETEHDHGHDTEHCSVCHQLLIAPGKFTTGSEPDLPDSNLREDDIEFHSQFFVIAFHFESFSPRPPPQRLVS
jgi:hypothetical protein